MKIHSLFIYTLLFLASISAQNRKLVWADEFNDSIDFSVWDYDIGGAWGGLHYYTNRPKNMTIVDSALNIIVREENYMGFDYTSARMKTKINWRYGRFEASIKLPETTGFVPAFWLLPADNIYGWWPNSGEIDIMEQPTNQPATIYGTIHTEVYNYFGAANPPQGDTIHIPDAQTSYHLYAIEWTPDKIDFFVDDQKYFTFFNDQASPATWPFEKSFYIILNVAVGGSWSGDPDSTTIFPAVMEVDYVRVYQYFNDITIQGSDFLLYNSSDNYYSVADFEGASYSWEIPGNAQNVSGQNTQKINVDWNYFGGEIKANVISSYGSQTLNFPVRISNNLLNNPGFEKGVKYWKEVSHFPAEVDFNLDTNNVFYGDQSLSIEVQSLGLNPWDIQCSQREILLEADEEYLLSFWAKTNNSNGNINAAIVSDNPFVVYYEELIPLTNNWTKYEINYTATVTDTIGLNIDFGYQTGKYYIDNFLLTTPDLMNSNQIINGDFFDADSNWNLVTLSGAQAESNMINGELEIAISNPGNDIWDIHLGQSDIDIENGEEYTIFFDAYAVAPRNITALVGKNSAPWTVYHPDQIFSLTTSKQSFTFSFVLNDPSDHHSRFGFDIGGSSTDVFFDNIRITSENIPTSISSTQSILKSFKLFQNYPNPFNPNTSIKYSIFAQSYALLKIFNVLGKEISTLVNKDKPAGIYQVNFDASNLPSGVYFYKLSAGNFVETKKMILLK
jgi:beta-glucanase (GH16 family)